ncbi:MAG: ABC transporter ATP-binding protein [Chloroflexi bacterium]|nr:ABC transporter ATP-binding protein [Chloroflexota bacterium]MBI5052510.1 ABC transporter ATP-binding protein [Chloroflexota bacterium]MBI5080699.1 ABC transporter ATP-binding protein [Chloroflexota bacterium]MBI5715201.1 ABC transporter ATP-binding protein [Chloroflexota bacterium]
MIEARHLTKYFDDFLAVESASFHVPAGNVLALLGPNGAGKTTTVRMLTSILKPTSGTASVAGYDIVTQPDQVRASVGVLTEHHGLYLRTSGEEYLDFFGDIYGVSKDVRRKRIKNLLERFGLADAGDRHIGGYSKGMRQKLALIRSMLHDPPVLLLDEPTSAMDPQSAKQVRDAIADLRQDNRAIILCTHNLAEAEELADSIAIVRKGRIIALGNPDALKDQLLGAKEMEVRLAASFNGVGDTVSDLVTIVARGDSSFRYRAENFDRTNPILIKRLLDQNAPIVSLTEVPRSLEAVYLRAVEEDEAS